MTPAFPSPSWLVSWLGMPCVLAGALLLLPPDGCRLARRPHGRDNVQNCRKQERGLSAPLTDQLPRTRSGWRRGSGPGSSPPLERGALVMHPTEFVHTDPTVARDHLVEVAL